MKRLIFLFGVMAAMPQAWSQTVMPADTLQSVTLEEVKVTRSAIVDKSDRKLLIPTEKQLRMSSNGVDLLRNMQMPMLTVDIVNDQIKLSGNGSLAICINGREADIADVKALDPRTVKRIEFHESPSMRYGGVDGVIDYIVEQPTSGGSFVASGQQSYVGWGNYNVSGKFNKGNSQFGLYGNFGERYGFTNWRDNEERYQTLDGQQFTRTEKGLPGTTETPWYAVALDYGYSKSDKMLFVVQAKFRGNPGHVTEFNGELANSYSSGWQRVFDRSAYDRIRPSLDLYWQRNMQHGQSLMLNVVGTYDSKQSEHFYHTENHGISQDDADLQTVIDSRSYSLIANGNYEKRWDIGRLTAGIRYSHGWGDNDYLSSHVREKTREGKTLVYAEWWQPIREKFDYKLSIAGKQRSFRIAGEEPTNTFDVIASLEKRVAGFGRISEISRKSGVETLSEIQSDSAVRVGERRVFRPVESYLRLLQESGDGGQILGDGRRRNFFAQHACQPAQHDAGHGACHSACGHSARLAYGVRQYRMGTRRVERTPLRASP